MSEILSDDPWLAVSWDDPRQCLIAEWKAFANSRELRAGGRKILDAIRDRQATSMVSDNRGLKVMAAPDQEWFSNAWTPMAVHMGLKRIAVVLAPGGLGRLVSEEILGRIGNRDFVTRTFESRPDALAWISSRGSDPAPKKE